MTMGHKHSISRPIIIPELKDVTLKGVEPIGKNLGSGAYASVHSVRYNGAEFAAKSLHPILYNEASDELKDEMKNNFVQECLRLSNLRHPNIVEFKGVYYDTSKSHMCSFPIMVMELMDTTLDEFVESRRTNIPFSEKVSILRNISQGLCFLHGHKPQIIHRDLTSNNVLLTRKLVAKIGDLGMSKVIPAGSKKAKGKHKMTQGKQGTPDFMPPEVMPVEHNVYYDASMDVFSLGGIALHLLSEEWPSPGPPKEKDPITKEMRSLSEVERRKQYLDKIIGNYKAPRLIEMVKKCLNDDPDKRPTIYEVFEIIDLFFKVAIDLYMHYAKQKLPMCNKV